MPITLSRARDARGRRTPTTLAGAIVIALIATVAAAEGQPAGAAGRGDPALAGGATSNTTIDGVNAFSQPAANLDFAGRLDFSVGNSFFRNPWVSAPSSTTARDGLGPLFNTNACQGCHIKDGRGRPPGPDDTHGVSTLLRLGRGEPVAPPRAPRLGTTPDARYGPQLQDFALPGLAPEARIDWRWTYRTVSLGSGEKVELRAPAIELVDLAYGPLDPATRIGPRVAPPMIGLGLLEAIPAAAILAAADPDDSDGDGISGKPNRAFDVTTGAPTLGRFGWKAEQPNVRQQAAGAFLGDMGLTTSLFPHNPCPPAQRELCDVPDGGSPEVSDEILDAVAFYARHLAPPARLRANDPDVLRGEKIFAAAGCDACHSPSWVTGESASAALAAQTIYPYTDLLLHDLGADLADGIHVYEAGGNEWRTAPLWGLGRHAEVNGNTQLLHDGRARNPLEAILWHGGEAAPARARVVAMSAGERASLLAFLDSL